MGNEPDEDNQPQGEPRTQGVFCFPRVPEGDEQRQRDQRQDDNGGSKPIRHGKFAFVFHAPAMLLGGTRGGRPRLPDERQPTLLRKKMNAVANKPNAPPVALRRTLITPPKR